MVSDISFSKDKFGCSSTPFPFCNWRAQTNWKFQNIYYLRQFRNKVLRNNNYVKLNYFWKVLQTVILQKIIIENVLIFLIACKFLVNLKYQPIPQNTYNV